MVTIIFLFLKMVILGQHPDAERIGQKYDLSQPGLTQYEYARSVY